MLPSNRRAPLQRKPSRGGVWCKCDYPRLRQRRTFAGAPTLYLWAATSRWCNGECIAYKSTRPGGSGSRCRFGQEKASEWFPGLGKRQKAKLKRRRFVVSQGWQVKFQVTAVQSAQGIQDLCLQRAGSGTRGRLCASLTSLTGATHSKYSLVDVRAGCPEAFLVVHAGRKSQSSLHQ